jgi:transcriptional regulator with XRE-family HTH domain
MDQEKLGGRVRAARKARDLSQETLARAAGVSLNLVNKLERGVITDPHYSTLHGLAGALEVSVEDLAGRAPVPLVEASETGPPEEDPLRYLRVLRAFIWKTHDRWKEDRPQTGREAAAVVQALETLLGEGVFDLKEGSVNPSEWFELAFIRDGARKLASIAEEIEGEESPRQRRTLHLVQEKLSA